MNPKLKLQRLKKHVLQIGDIEKQLKAKARTDMTANAALVAVRSMLENAQGEIHRHVRTYGLRS